MVMQMVVGNSWRTFDVTVALEDVAGVSAETSLRRKDADLCFKL
jgi:hypothetical protein